jgi:hypothetical protein
MIENEDIITMLCLAVGKWVVARNRLAIAEGLLSTERER